MNIIRSSDDIAYNENNNSMKGIFRYEENE